MRWRFWRRPAPPIDMVLDRIGTESPPYSEMDRYRDFRQIFLSTDQGKRVLREIYRLSKADESSAFKSGYETNETMYREGARGLALAIIDVINVEPTAARPQTTRRGSWQKTQSQR